MAPSGISHSQLAHRARDYWNVDGLPTLVAASVYLVCVGGFFSLVFMLKASWVSNWFLGSVFRALAGAAIMTLPFWAIAFLIWWIVNNEDVIEWFKLRITYPRTGYVAPPSYWKNESAKEPAEQINLREKNRFCQLLIVLGGYGFWFWILSVTYILSVLFWEGIFSGTVRVLMLGLLLAIRGLRFGLYPERVQSESEDKALQRVDRFLRSVMNSFWVWILLLDLMNQSPLGFRRWLVPGVRFCIAVYFIASALRQVYCIANSLRQARNEVDLLQEALFWLCGFALMGFLISRRSVGSFALALMVPGLCAVLFGGLKLFRYLRANPWPS